MYLKHNGGMVEVISGPMFSGKSEELIRRVNILGHAQVKTLIVKHSIDNRWKDMGIMSRNGCCVSAKTFKSSDEIKQHTKKEKYGALVIDEVQFFDDGIVDLIKALADQGLRIIISGLDRDYLGNPFGNMPQILAIADRVDKQFAICNQCRKAATMTYRVSDHEDLVVVGDKEYEPRCRKCHIQGMREKRAKKRG